ncbi:hypothetical protein [Nocardioides panaciterrulae]|uniref:Uncharacterized protein n=1 Tax=Nocardioides panaciterrulae TaxID=661492 RepID=A0A7Y9JCY1_9ACTN|nr:hypothetical protein [Nocardioides panaciterrulae]NYD43913.1 hypothetical protein [Nocardioides panaciterrulae]
MQVVLVRWRPRTPGWTTARLHTVLDASTAPADQIAHVRVEDDAEEWRLAMFVHSPTAGMARAAVQALVIRTAASLPVRPDVLDVEVVTEWFRLPR